jgi:hypothetical protein
MSLSSQIPRIEDCDPDDPDQALLWASMYIPVAGRSPMVWPRMIAEMISKHYTECGIVHAPSLARLANADGFIHVDDLPKQQKQFMRPYRGQQSPFNGSGGWMGMDEVEEDPINIQDPVEMTVHEREAQVERYRYLGYKVNEPEPEAPKARVVPPEEKPPRFNPAEHSATEVNAYLRDLADELEFKRVLHAERNGQARKGILKRFPEGTA